MRFSTTFFAQWRNGSAQEFESWLVGVRIPLGQLIDFELVMGKTKFIYTTDKLKGVYTTSPFMALPNESYINEEAIKQVLAKEEFLNLKRKLRTLNF